ncbi:hypothetical protein LUZ60_015069 [Juncus effusus]|nr:hypothetical protein LUZ60_015069 [Juncus effusus]
MEKSRTHVVVIPVPSQGHVTPAIHLTLRLAERGFTITFINTESIHRLFSSDPFLSARESGLDIRYLTVSDGLPLSFDRSLSQDRFMDALLNRMPVHVEELLRTLMDEADVPIRCLILDSFLTWPSTLAEKLGLPYVSFFTQPALVLAVYYYIDILIENGHVASKENHRTDPITYIHGVSSIEPTDIPSYLQDFNKSSFMHQIIYNSAIESKRANLILCNTIEELESNTVSALKLQKPIYSIGPINNFPIKSERNIVTTSLWTESTDCINWLDSNKPNSVLYISFGSIASISERDLNEISKGIMESEVNFLWSIRAERVESGQINPLSQEFLEGTKERGKIVKWCNQAEVLSHPSIGGFLTHCGWNSVLESLLSGVPMLCFPLISDQFVNRKLVVRDWRVGLSIGELGDVASADVAKCVRSLMREKEGMEIRVEMKKLRGLVEGAMEENGSSKRNFDQFVMDLTKISQM